MNFSLPKRMFVLVSLFCYFAATFTASAHGFPTENVGDASSVMEVMVEEDHEMAKDCHSPEPIPCSLSESSACKILCAVMAQALAYSEETFALNYIASDESGFFLGNNALSRKLSVEPRPPKQTF